MCVNLLSSSLRDRVELKREYGAIGRVYGPAGQVNQVFRSILNNAQQAIERGHALDLQPDGAGSRRECRARSR